MLPSVMALAKFSQVMLLSGSVICGDVSLGDLNAVVTAIQNGSSCTRHMRTSAAQRITFSARPEPRRGSGAAESGRIMARVSVATVMSHLLEATPVESAVEYDREQHDDEEQDDAHGGGVAGGLVVEVDLADQR